MVFMRPQTSTDYNVDNRYQETKAASDNVEGKQFLNRYINADKAADRPTVTLERKQDDRFVMSAPGWGTNYSFKNAFGAQQSPAQRRLARLG